MSEYDRVNVCVLGVNEGVNCFLNRECMDYCCNEKVLVIICCALDDNLLSSL